MGVCFEPDGVEELVGSDGLGHAGRDGFVPFGDVERVG